MHPPADEADSDLPQTLKGARNQSLGSDIYGSIGQTAYRFLSECHQARKVMACQAVGLEPDSAGRFSISRAAASVAACAVAIRSNPAKVTQARPPPR
jgi:hypothetical protein